MKKSLIEIFKKKWNKETLNNILKLIKIGINHSISIISFIFEKGIAPLMQILKRVWTKIEKKKKKKVAKRERLKIKSETRL